MEFDLLEERAREGGGGMELEGGCELMNELIYIYISNGKWRTCFARRFSNRELNWVFPPSPGVNRKGS
jgi:hypothetical protein